MVDQSSVSDALALVAWLKDQITEDERIARSVTSAGAWSLDVEPNGTVWAEGLRLVAKGLYPEDADHIALHDPARVLREVAAKRRLMAEHAVPDDEYSRNSGDRSCVGCGFGNDEERLVGDIEECPVLRTLASVYADRSGYLDSWRPE